VTLDGVTAAFAAGLALGFGSGLAPGPLLALTVSITLQRGTRAGVMVSLAPLITDVLIIVLALTIVTRLPPVAVGVLTVAGGVLVAVFAWENWRASRHATLTPQAKSEPLVRHPLVQGIGLNLLNPAAWLFWITAGAAMLIGFWQRSPVAALVFVVTFYVLLVGTKIVLAVAIGAGRERLNVTTYRRLLRLSAAILLAVAIALLLVGVNTLYR
jgi:threonine/homoserine/homoserine lactone efflux protein